MKGRILKTIKKHWITAWMVSALLILSAIVGSAAYTRVSISKRVVSTDSGSGVLFSSNYMESPAKPSIETPDSSVYTGNNHPSYTVNVCNYAQGDQAVWFDRKNISYTLKARIVNYSDHSLPSRSVQVDSEEGEEPTTIDPLAGKTYTIAKITNGVVGTPVDLTANGLVNGYYSFPAGILSSERAISDEYVVTLDNFDVTNSTPTYVIELVATPTSTFGGAISEIIGYVGIAERTEAKANWVGEISDDNYSGNNTYDAYNYLIYGSGKSVLTFMWNPDEVEVSHFFLAEHPSTDCVAADNHPNWKKIVIERSVDDPARFDIQLFKTDNFSNISGAVDFKVSDYVPPVNNNEQGQGNG